MDLMAENGCTFEDQRVMRPWQSSHGGLIAEIAITLPDRGSTEWAGRSLESLPGDVAGCIGKLKIFSGCFRVVLAGQ
jgi:hypothetical protein